MNVKTRTTAQGTEYWDAKEKRIRFVPAGQDPDFEVTENPKSMVMDVDLATGEDKTVINRGDSGGTNLEDMTIPQLKEFAQQIEVEIPSEVKKKEDIIKFLIDSK
jgi:hypothetical protein